MLHFQNSTKINSIFNFLTSFIIVCSTIQTCHKSYSVTQEKWLNKHFLSLTHLQEMTVLLCFRMCKADAHFTRTLWIIEPRHYIIENYSEKVSQEERLTLATTAAPSSCPIFPCTAHLNASFTWMTSSLPKHMLFSLETQHYGTSYGCCRC